MRLTSRFPTNLLLFGENVTGSRAAQASCIASVGGRHGHSAGVWGFGLAEVCPPGLTALLTCQVRKASGWSLTGSAPRRGATTRSPSWTASTGSSPCAQVRGNDVARQARGGEVSVRVFPDCILHLGRDRQPFPDLPFPPPTPPPSRASPPAAPGKPANARASPGGLTNAA